MMFKRALADWLLKDERAAVERERAQLELSRKAVSIVSLGRELLKGFDPKALDPGDMSLEEELGEELIPFLAQVHELTKNDALPRILAHLTRFQIFHTAKWAENMPQANFGRATINGLSLVREEIDRLEGVYQEKHAPPEQYDPHAVV
jgi:hypothetical protein